MPRLRGEICKSNTKSQQINLNVADSHYGVHYWMDQCPVMVIRPLRKRFARPIQLFPVIFCIFFYILVSQIWDFGGSRRGRRDKKISQSGVNQPTTTSPTLKMAVSRWFFIKKQKKTKGCSYVDSSQFVGSFPEEKKEKSLLFTVRFKRHLCSIALVWHKWSYIMIIIVWKNVSYLTEESPLGHLTNGLRIG